MLSLWKYLMLELYIRIRRAWVKRRAEKLMLTDKNMARRYLEYQRSWVEAYERKLRQNEAA